jgi:DNA (cytosine-5)-methyltransferase 1
MGFDEKKIVVSDTQAYRQFGNAVVPKVVAAVGKQIMKIMFWKLSQEESLFRKAPQKRRTSA